MFVPFKINYIAGRFFSIHIIKIWRDYARSICMI